MSLHFNTFIKLALTPPVPILPTFAAQSRPDYTFEVAGLTIEGHNPGLTWGGWSYLTIETAAPLVREIPAVNEPPSIALSVIGAAIVYKLCRRKGA